ncbi:MAG: carboxypeptidase Taq [Fusobacteriaceae bacterium]|jgi:carboxypeptidase Taq|nr:carboxypeptidase Taq [Fusobacteriaceae bacterium]
MDIQKNIEKIKELTNKMKAYEHAMAMLQWDMETEAPKASVEKTSKTMGFFITENYNILLSKEMKENLDILNENIDKLDELNAKIVEELTKEYDKATKIPVDEYSKYQQLVTKAQVVWEEAKTKKDYNIFKPYLKDIIEYNKKFIEYRGYEGHKYNTLLDDYEPGLTVEKADIFFNALKENIVPLLKDIEKSTVNIDNAKLNIDVAIEKQKKFAKFLAEYINFNFDRGVLKESMHPFTLNFSNKDVRITTHYYKNNILSSIFSVLHEGGHGIYEQGISDEVSETILGHGTSMGIHESQSRMYENMFGRSIEFWQGVYDKFIETFDEFKDISLEEFYKLINKVENSKIRVEADELTYSLHVLVRYEIEKAIFNDEVTVDELPNLWNKKMKEYLNVNIENDAEGVLQDVHWSAGLFGYFPSYALGNAYAAQIYNKLSKDIDIKNSLLNGEFEKINKYLNEKIHKYGKMKKPLEIIKNITNEELNPQYFCDYLKEKYSKIYEIKQ